MYSKLKVLDLDGKTTAATLDKPELFNVELRSDLVRMAYDNMRQNKRQPYAVSPTAGMQHSAESWGTGRAMARVPRVKASGTRRSGQAAFANFARKGRMAHPTKTHRRWHKKTPLHVRRLACLMGVAASANAAVVEARGHRISQIEQLPIIVSNKIQELKRSSDAMALLKALNVDEDLQKVADSKTITCGKGKLRNRRYNQRKGVLIVHTGETLCPFRNIKGVEFVHVDSMSVLNLCPGGQMGRLVIWKESAFKRLEKVFSEETKGGFALPNRLVSTENLSDYFYSPEIQSLITVPSLLPKGTCKKSDEDAAEAQKFIAMF